MFRVLRGVGGERVFKAATISALVLLAVFFIGIIASMVAYTEWDTFIEALLSEEILFAINRVFAFVSKAHSVFLRIKD